MIGGLVKKGLVPSGNIIGSDVNEALVKQRAEEFGISTTADNGEVVKAADYLVLAVKPQYAKEVIEGFKDEIGADTVVISIMAGKSLQWLEETFGKKLKFVRCMPNTAALVGEAITAATPNELVTEEELKTSLEILESFGRASVVPERLMDAVVGLSGSGPAYVFMFIEALADGAVQCGMPRAQAYEFAAQLVYGSSKLMIDTGKHPGELKDMVCSPAGTTIAAVKVLEEKGFRGAVIDAVEAAALRSREL